MLIIGTHTGTYTNQIYGSNTQGTNTEVWIPISYEGFEYYNEDEDDELELTSSYLDDWPNPEYFPPPWKPARHQGFTPKRWLPPRCLLKSLVIRRDFPSLP